MDSIIQLSHLSHLFRRFLGSRVDVSNHDEPALSLSVAHSGRMLFSFISCFILSIHLSLGLPLGRDPGTWVARTYFAILCSSLLWTWPNQDNRFFVRKVFIGCTWAFSRMVVFVIWSFLVFPCIHLNIFISVVFIRLWSLFRIGQHSPPYVIAGLIAVLYILFFNASGTFLSQMTPDISRHLFQPDWILLVTSFSHPPSACKVEPKYLKESTTGSRSPNRNISSWQFRGLRYSVFFLFIFRPFSSNTLLQHRLHIYPLWICEIFCFRAIDNWVMFKLTGQNYHSIIPHQHM